MRVLPAIPLLVALRTRTPPDGRGLGAVMHLRTRGIPAAVLVSILVVVSGCVGPAGDPNGVSIGPSTASSAVPKCPNPPLVGHWKMTNESVADYFANPTDREGRTAYAFTRNGTADGGSYQVVHEDHNTNCQYQVVAALIFLTDQPGVATFTFAGPNHAKVENDQAWPDRPGNFTVEYIDGATSP